MYVNVRYPDALHMPPVCFVSVFSCHPYLSLLSPSSSSASSSPPLTIITLTCVISSLVYLNSPPFLLQSHCLSFCVHPAASQQTSDLSWICLLLFINNWQELILYIFEHSDLSIVCVLRESPASLLLTQSSQFHSDPLQTQ